MLGYLIRPDIQRCSLVKLSEDHGECSKEMKKLIGVDVLSYQRVTEGGDTLWLDDLGLMRKVPVFAFKLPVQHYPYAGNAIITPGETPDGKPFARPEIPLEVILHDIEWLGEILPEVTTVIEGGGTTFRQIVTYERVRRQ